MLTEGPLDDFLQALDDLLHDVNAQIEDETEYWEVRTSDHE